MNESSGEQRERDRFWQDAAARHGIPDLREQWDSLPSQPGEKERAIVARGLPDLFGDVAVACEGFGL